MYSPEKPDLQEIECMLILSTTAMNMPILTEQLAERSRDCLIFSVKETDTYNTIEIVLKTFFKQAHTIF